jgi:hypothetical protein
MGEGLVKSERRSILKEKAVEFTEDLGSLKT